MTASQNNVSKVYKSVIDEVIKNVREDFLNDGVDEQVLQELKQIWESKVTQSEAVSVSIPEPKQRVLTQNPQILLPQTPVTDSAQHQLNVVRKNTPQVAVQSGVAMQPGLTVHQAIASATPVMASASSAPVTVNQQGQHYIMAQPQYIQQPHAQFTQIMVPGTNVATIQQQIPEAAQANQQPIHHTAYHGISVSAIQQPTRQTMQSVHNQHVTAQQQTSRPSVIRLQVDGPNDSDSDEDDDDDDDDLNELSHDDDPEDEDKSQEDSKPLGPEDDVSDDEKSDPFDTDNVVVCQFDRITRSKNKWKFHLKDGIMNLNTKDYVFTKATGEAEW